MNLNNDLFSVYSLTEAINLLPPKPTRIRQMGLFSEKGITKTTVLIESLEGELRLIESVPRGAPPPQASHNKRKIRSLTVPHLPLEDVVLPEDVDGVRAFGTESELLTVARVVNDKLQALRDRFDTTLEWMMLSAIKGVVVDGGGNTICNLFTEFGITQQTVDFELDVDTTEVLLKCHEVKRKIENNLKGEVATGFHVFCSSSFFDYLVTHDAVKDAFKGYAAAQSVLAADNRKGFTFGGLTFEEYNFTVTDADGNSVDWIADNEAYAFPVGTSLFKVYFAPAAFNETVNTIGKPLYAKMQERKYGKGYDLYVESNPLPVCLNPGVLIKLTV